MGQLPTSMSVPLLLFGQPDPVGLGTAVPSCCCFWGKKTDPLGTNIHSPGPNSFSSAQQLCIAKFPLKQFWIEKKAVSWRTMPGNFLGISTRNKKEDSVCLFPSLKGIPQTSQPGQNLPLQGKRLYVHFWPSGLKGTVTQATWIDVEEKWNTIRIFWVAQNNLKKNTLEHTQTKLYKKLIVPVKQMVTSTQGVLTMGRALAYVQSNADLKRYAFQHFFDNEASTKILRSGQCI